MFTLAELSKLYASILEDLSADQPSIVHTTRLRQKLEVAVPDLVFYKHGRDIHLAFDRRATSHKWLVSMIRILRHYILLEQPV